MINKKFLFNTLLYDDKSNFGFREYVRNLFFLFNESNVTFLFRKSQKIIIEKYKLKNNLIFKCIYIDDFIWRIKLIAISFFLKEKYDVYIHTFNYGPLIMRGKNICIVHDLQFRHSAFKNSFLFKFQRNIFLKHHFLSYDAFIFISNYSKYDFILKYGIRDNLHVIPNFLNIKKYSQITQIKSLLNKKYFLCVSSSLWYKNLDFLISEFNDVNRILSNQNKPNFNLVFVSNIKTQNENIKVFDKLPQKQLNFLYKNCEMVILPSLFEGFGFPYIESAIFNKPLIAFDMPVSREVREGIETVFFNQIQGQLSSSMLKILDNNKSFRNTNCKIDNFTDVKIQRNLYNKLFTQL